jgi:O-antigen ligase
MNRAGAAPRRPAAASAPAAPAAPRDWERLFATLLMAAVTTPGMLLLGVSDALDAPDTPLLRYYWLPIYAATLGLCAWRGPRLARFWLPGLFAAAIVGWAWASKDWSVIPEISSRRAMALFFTTLLGLYLGGVFGGRRLPVMLSDAFLPLAVGSILVSVALPSVGVQHDGETSGAWRGLWAHKNMLGAWMGLGSLSAVAAAFLEPERRRRHLVTLALCTFLLLMCRSKGMLLCWGLTMAVAAILGLARRGPVLAVVSVWIAGALGGFLALGLALNPGAFLAAIGKSPTLTGRTDIWASVLRRVDESPWLGFGFAAFWEKGSVPAEVVKKETGWLVPNAHNGWLDLLLQVGWVGVGLLAFVIAVALIGCIVRSRARTDGWFGLLFLIFYVATSLSESVLELHNSLPWALFIAVFAFACGPRPDRPPEPRPGPRRRSGDAARAPFDWSALDAQAQGAGGSSGPWGGPALRNGPGPM